MRLADVLERYPHTVELCGGRHRFYRQLDHSLRVRDDTPTPGSGARREFSETEVRRVAIRKLLGNLVGGDVPHGFDHAIDVATFDHDQHTVTLAVPGHDDAPGAAITLCVPDELWPELASELFVTT